MESQTPYYTGAPKKSNVGLIVGIIIGALFVCCGLPVLIFGYLGYHMVTNAVGFIYCGTTMAQLRDASLAYAKDHDGKLPPAETWQDDIQKYVKPMVQKDKTFTPPDPNGPVCDAQAKSTFTYNTDLAGKKLSDIKDPSNTIIFWESPGSGRNKAQKFAKLNSSDGPSFIANMKRSWILQPLNGLGYYYTQNQRQEIPDISSEGQGNINIQTHSQTTG